MKALSRKKQQGVSVRVLLDETQYKKPSCKQQPASIALMLEWGVEFRSFKPDRGAYAVMHAKTWVVDGTTALVGSPNFTVNGMEKSEEVLTIIRCDGYISQYMEWFEQLWRVAEEVNTGTPTPAAAAEVAPI